MKARTQRPAALRLADYLEGNATTPWAASTETKISALMSKISTLVDKRLSCEPCAEAEEDLLQFIRTWYAAPTYLAEEVPSHYRNALPPHGVVSAEEHWAETEHAKHYGLEHLVPRRTPLYTHPTTQGLDALDALDAARYRFLRDTYWGDDKELAAVITLQMNKVWDEKIDAAITQSKKGDM